jgi:hypothetical protein
VVVYTIVPATGELAGVEIDTAVSVAELAPWPTVVPHWLHFPAEIAFANTNSDATDCLPGWLRHSRDIGRWNTTALPLLAWLAHVRGVLSAATKGG